jgi:hypothetical protein
MQFGFSSFKGMVVPCFLHFWNVVMSFTLKVKLGNLGEVQVPTLIANPISFRGS